MAILRDRPLFADLLHAAIGLFLIALAAWLSLR
jgi:hypothetical protein